MVRRAGLIAMTVSSLLAASMSAVAAQPAVKSVVGCGDVIGQQVTGAFAGSRVVLGLASVPPARIQRHVRRQLLEVLHQMGDGNSQWRVRDRERADSLAHPRGDHLGIIDPDREHAAIRALPVRGRQEAAMERLPRGLLRGHAHRVRAAHLHCRATFADGPLRNRQVLLAGYCCEPAVAPERDQRPDCLDHAERPRPRQEPVAARQRAADREREHEAAVARLERVHAHHERDGAGPVDREHASSLWRALIF